MISYSKQNILNQDIEAVKKVLKSDFITQGPVITKFEKKVSNYCGVRYAKAMNSATSALHVACMSLGLKKNDWVWTSPNTFVSSANCALMCGAKIDFIDIDLKTYNIDTVKLEKKLIVAKEKGILPKIVIPVHFGGQPCEMQTIFNLSKKYKFKIIEDASHAIGATYSLIKQAKKTKNRRIKIGSCLHSDIVIFSFHAVKVITSAEGGMALTNNKKISEKMSELRTHGITRNKEKFNSTPTNEIWNYQQINLGYNYRMSEVQAALGLSQMKNLNKFIQRRRDIAKIYNNNLTTNFFEKPLQRKNTFSSYHLYPLILKKTGNKAQIKLFKYLSKNGVLPNLHYIPVHLQPYYKNLGFRRGDFPIAEKYFSKAISLPIYPTLTNGQQNKIIKLINSFSI